MGALQLLPLSAFIVLALLVEAQPNGGMVSAEVNIWKEIEEVEVFSLKESVEGCPEWVKVLNCPKSGIFVYYKCCGLSCCRRFQGWVLGLIAAVIGLLILRWLVNLFRDLCCCRYRKWKKDRSKRRKSKHPHHYTTDSDFDDGEKEELREVKSAKKAKGKGKKDRGRGSSKDDGDSGGGRKNERTQHPSQDQASTPRRPPGPAGSNRHNETQQEWIDDGDDPN